MAMIDSDHLKLGSDAAQAARKAWHAAIAAMNAHDPADLEGRIFATDRAQVAGEVYNDLARDLAREVHFLIAEAERAAEKG